MSRRRTPTQNERPLKMLRAVGSRGLTQYELDHPPDGLGPIRRVASRVHDLKREGHRIEVRARRGGMAVYVLREAARPAHHKEAAPAVGPIFEASPAPRSALLLGVDQ